MTKMNEIMCPFFLRPYKGEPICRKSSPTETDTDGKTHEFDNRCTDFKIESDNQFNFNECQWYNTSIALLMAGLPSKCPYRKTCLEYCYESSVEKPVKLTLEDREDKACSLEDENPLSYLDCFYFSEFFWDKKS